MDQALEKAEHAFIASLGAHKSEKLIKLLKGFAMELARKLPNISVNICIECIEAGYWIILHETGKLPSRQESKEEFQKVVKDCESLAGTLNSIHPFVRYSLQYGFFSDPNRRRSDPTFDLMQFTTDLNTISEHIKIYSKGFILLLSSKGPQTDGASNLLIEKLALAYETTTGESAPRGVIAGGDHKGFHGEFFDLVLGCTQALGKRYHSNDALGQRIRRVLNKRGKQA